LKRVLVIGSGPIVIGQACEFDYSGSQACKALRDEGLEVVLVNSNPATIMTDPELADRTYVEPLTTEFLEAVIARERPDAILPTVGGQAALNLAVDLANAEFSRCNVKLIGASIEAIKIAEDRQLFKDAMRSIGLDVPQSGLRARCPRRSSCRACSDFRWSSARRLRSAGSAAASPTTSTSSTTSPNAASS
jgi:carbamoyl-phosphate synthase large subunit